MSSRLLLVEDHEDSRDLWIALLALRGIEAIPAHDAETALRIARDEKPEVAILDIGLPDGDGHDLAIQLRALPGLERICLIAVTGYGTPEARRRSAAAGIDVHLVKPVTVDQVMQALATHAPTRTSD